MKIQIESLGPNGYGALVSYVRRCQDIGLPDEIIPILQISGGELDPTLMHSPPRYKNVVISVARPLVREEEIEKVVSEVNGLVKLLLSPNLEVFPPGIEAERD